MRILVSALLNHRDFEILKFLAIHPTSTTVEVARYLDFRAETVSVHMRSLKEAGLYEGTMGLLCYQKLDLAYVPVVVSASLTTMDALYAACRSHPYIAYSARILGSTDGAFFIFTIPQKALRLLAEFLDELAANRIIIDHKIYLTDDTKRGFLRPDFEIFNPQTGAWAFDWNRWQEEDGKVETAANGGQLEDLPVEPEVHRLERGDIELLGILSEDAKVPTNEISKAMNLPAHKVRRRIRFLEHNGFIIGYRTMIAFSKLRLSSSVLFNCSALNKELEYCRRKLLQLPFPGTFIPVQNGFLCQAALPVEGLPIVQRVLARYCNKVEVSWFDLSESDVATLNSKAFINRGWRTDRTFLVDEPTGTTRESQPYQTMMPEMLPTGTS